MCVWEMQHHIYPIAVLRPPSDTGLLRSLFDEGVSNFKVSVLLLEGVLVVEENVAIQILKASGLAEAQELVVNETILNGVELVDVVDDVLGLFLNTMLHQGLTALAPAGHGGGVRSRREGGERARKHKAKVGWWQIRDKLGFPACAVAPSPNTTAAAHGKVFAHGSHVFHLINFPTK